MLEHFTEDEIERMHAFTQTPTYEREPEQLLPDDAEDVDEDETGEREQPRRSY